MTDHGATRALTSAILTAVLLAACSAPGANPSSTTSASPSADPPEPSLGVVPSVSPSPQSSPVKPPTPEPPMPEPPAASLSVDGGDPVVGQLGTFTWENGGSDAPWLDGSPIHVGAGEQLTLTLAAPAGIGDWRVSRVVPGNRDGIGAAAMAEGSGEPLTFEAPPPGTWSVEVSVAFTENRGSALYFWLIEVD